MAGKIKLLGIAPYDKLKDAMEQIGNSYPDIELDCFTGDMYEALAIVQQMPPYTYDCILSRGGTATLLEKETDLPVVEIHTSVYDVLRAIQLADNYGESYAVIGFPNITEPAHTLCNLLGKEIRIETIERSDQVSASLRRLEEEGFHTVICDMITHTVAQQIGLNAILIGTGAEGLHTAMAQAISYAHMFTPYRNESVFLRNIAEVQNGIVVVLDDNGAVVYSYHVNPTDALIPHLRSRIHDIPQKGSMKFYYSDGGQLYSITADVIRVNNENCYMFYASLSPIAIHTQFQGIRYMNKSECEYLVENSFYSISGALGSMDSEISHLSSSNQPVMIRGEAGTGKEQIARYIYIHGRMINRPFVSVDCEIINDKSWEFLINHYNSPLNDTMITVYFQGMEHLTEAQLTRLLSLIHETGTAKRVRLMFSFVCPDSAPVPDQLREFTAKAGCILLHVPSLKNRKDEISFLASLYLNSLNVEQGKSISGFDVHAVNLLRQYDWPNNYTQFKHVLETLVTLTSTNYIQSDTVAEILERERALYMPRQAETAVFSEDMTMDDIMEQVIRQRLAANNGNKAATARQLNISRTTLWRYLGKMEE